MDKVLNINGKSVGFRSTASTPMRYRNRFGRDIFDDLLAIQNDLKKEEGFSLKSLEAFEFLSYTMAKQYDPSIPDTPEDWLDEFESFSIYEYLAEIMDLWARNESTTSEAKKN